MLVGLLQLIPGYMARATNHTDLLPYIRQEPHSVKNPCKGVKFPLKTFWVGQGYQAVVPVEEVVLDLHLPPPYLWGFLSLCHKRYSVSHHHIHRHIKISGDSGSPWVTPQNPLDSVLHYPLAQATIVIRYQYVCRRQYARGPTP